MVHRAAEHQLRRDVVLDEGAEHPDLHGAVVAATGEDEGHRTGAPAQQVTELPHRHAEGTLGRCTSRRRLSGSPTTWR